MSIESQFKAIMEDEKDMLDSVSAHTKRSRLSPKPKKLTTKNRDRRASRFSAADINKLKEGIVNDKVGTLDIKLDPISSDDDESVSADEDSSAFKEISSPDEQSVGARSHRFVRKASTCFEVDIEKIRCNLR